MKKIKDRIDILEREVRQEKSRDEESESKAHDVYSVLVYKSLKYLHLLGTCSWRERFRRGRQSRGSHLGGEGSAAEDLQEWSRVSSLHPVSGCDHVSCDEARGHRRCGRQRGQLTLKECLDNLKASRWWRLTSRRKGIVLKRRNSSPTYRICTETPPSRGSTVYHEKNM